MDAVLTSLKLAVIPCFLGIYRSVLARPVTLLKVSVLPGLAAALLLYAYTHVPPLPPAGRPQCDAGA